MIGATSSSVNKIRIVETNNQFLHNSQTKFLEKRNNRRTKLSRPFPKADCQINDGYFKASIINFSSNGAFIRTVRPFSVGQEIAMTFSFPVSKNTKMVTGEVARISDDGIGVVFKIFFSK